MAAASLRPAMGGGYCWPSRDATDRSQTLSYNGFWLNTRCPIRARHSASRYRAVCCTGIRQVAGQRRLRARRYLGHAPVGREQFVFAAHA